MSCDFVGGFLILSHQQAKLGVHRPCEAGDTTSFICHVTTILKYHVTLCVKYPHPKSPLVTAKFAVHRPCESADITFFICFYLLILFALLRFLFASCSRCHMTLWAGSPHLKSPPC